MIAEGGPTTRLPLAALFGANAISMVGNVLTIIAVPWFVLQTTGSAAKTGLTAFCAALAVVVASLLGGAVVDRLGYRRASIIADVASGAAVALVPTLRYTVGLAFWQLLALVFLANLCDAPGTTARTALVPAVAVRAGMGLERASASVQAIQRGARLLGAPLAGVLIAVIDPSRVLWVDAATFAFSAAIVALAVPTPAVARGVLAPEEATAGAEAAVVVETHGYLDDLTQGVRFIHRDRLTRAIVLTVMVTNFLDAPLFAVILPVYARQSFGQALDLGLMVAAFGGGALVGTLAFGAVGHMLPRRATFVGAFVGMGLPFWFLATLPSLPITIAALFCSGLASGPVNPIIFTVAYERIPPVLLGRVLGTVTAGAFVAIPLGILAAGYLLEDMGVRATLLGLAACYLVVTLSVLVNPAMADMSAPTAVAPSGARPI